MVPAQNHSNILLYALFQKEVMRLRNLYLTAVFLRSFVSKQSKIECSSELLPASHVVPMSCSNAACVASSVVVLLQPPHRKPEKENQRPFIAPATRTTPSSTESKNFLAPTRSLDTAGGGDVEDSDALLPNAKTSPAAGQWAPLILELQVACETHGCLLQRNSNSINQSGTVYEVHR